MIYWTTHNGLKPLIKRMTSKQLLCGLFAMALGLGTVGAHAEGNCPAGYYPSGGQGVMSCNPIPGYGGGQQQVPSVPAPVWKDRWGAIAGDKPRGILGAVTGFPSETSAQQAALDDCKTKGGIQCKLENSYRNGCTAMIVGDWGYNIASRATLDQAIASGIQKCKETDKNCTTYYSACSPPARIR